LDYQRNSSWKLTKKQVTCLKICCLVYTCFSVSFREEFLW
jgi:hypothetical protein